MSKTIIKLSKAMFKGGTSFPGRLALKIDSNILKTISKDYEVLVITGTNGKTTTTSMIYSMLKENGEDVITNSTGANMLSGIISCFIDNYTFKKQSHRKYAVIEVDEANLKYVTNFIEPKLISITNLFRDQLDRYGEVYTTLKLILEGVEKVPSATLILNGDESLLGDLKLPNEKIYYGFNCSVNDEAAVSTNADAKFCKICSKPYKYNYLTYNHLGSFYCEACGYSRPKLDYFTDSVLELNQDSSVVTFNSTQYTINQPGIYNVYNALCAYSIARKIGLPDTSISNSLKNQKSSFGRQELIKIGDKNLKIILVKNPAGFDEAIKTVRLDNRLITTAFLLNDNYADGRDVSWIWDVSFDGLADLDIDKVIVGGIRLYDMALRLKTAGLDSRKFAICESYDAILEAVTSSDSSTAYVLATYTAMINFRKYLHSKGYIKKLW